MEEIVIAILLNVVDALIQAVLLAIIEWVMWLIDQMLIKIIERISGTVSKTQWWILLLTLSVIGLYVWYVTRHILIS